VREYAGFSRGIRRRLGQSGTLPRSRIAGFCRAEAPVFARNRPAGILRDMLMKHTLNTLCIVVPSSPSIGSSERNKINESNNLREIRDLDDL
jgi:hypothetical protein